MKNKILVVDDEIDICELIELNLRSNGFEDLKFANDGKSALEIAKTWLPDLILLDLMLPEIDGMEVCRILKSQDSTKNIPIIMLTAKGSEFDILNGFECGADDYVTKPYSNRVLIARIKAQLRNSDKQENLSYKDLTLNLETHTVHLGTREIDLTFSEFEILQAFVKRVGRVYSRTELLSMLRGDDGFDITERAIDVQIVNLRKKLGEFGENIETVRGVGYKLKEL